MKRKSLHPLAEMILGEKVNAVPPEFFTQVVATEIETGKQYTGQDLVFTIGPKALELAEFNVSPEQGEADERRLLEFYDLYPPAELEHLRNDAAKEGYRQFCNVFIKSLGIMSDIFNIRGCLPYVIRATDELAAEGWAISGTTLRHPQNPALIGAVVIMSSGTRRITRVVCGTDRTCMIRARIDAILAARSPS